MSFQHSVFFLRCFWTSEHNARHKVNATLAEWFCPWPTELRVQTITTLSPAPPSPHPFILHLPHLSPVDSDLLYSTRHIKAFCDKKKLTTHPNPTESTTIFQILKTWRKQLSVSLTFQRYNIQFLVSIANTPASMQRVAESSSYLHAFKSSGIALSSAAGPCSD